MPNVWAVMPVYNEEEALPQVARDWSAALMAAAPDHVFCILNDGSKDGTKDILDSLARELPNIRAVHKANSGHGQTCVDGYALALEHGADWVLQIDSDGQCDPKYFATFWAQREAHPVLYGYRRKRLDGWQRMAISRVVTLVTFIATGTWVADANVPYRLMRADALRGIIGRIPKDFYLANILLAVLQKRAFGIRWIPIVFRDRAGGTPSVKPLMFGKQGWKLFRQLRRAANKDTDGRAS